MPENTKKNKGQKPQGQVVQLPLQCVFVECKDKPKRLNFCSDHFAWFKEGLVTRDGEKAKDFDKKFQAYSRRQHKKSA